MKDNGDALYTNHIEYSASMLRKCAKLYKDTAITINDDLVSLLKQQSLNPSTKEIEDIFPRKFPDKQNYQETVRKLAILTHIFDREV